MAQTAFVVIPVNWVLVSSLISTIEDGSEYLLESHGPGNILLQEADSLPAENDYAGILIDKYAYKIALYQNNGKNLYVRLERSSLPASLNVTKKEA